MSTTPRAPQDRQPKRDPRGLRRLTLGGKSRLLRFDGNAIIEACDATGTSSIQDILREASNLNIKMLRALVWAGLLHADPDVDLVEVGTWMGEGKVTFDDILVACISAVNAALGVDDETTERAVNEATSGPTRPRGGTGTRRSAPRSQPESDTQSSGD